MRVHVTAGGLGDKDLGRTVTLTAGGAEHTGTLTHYFHGGAYTDITVGRCDFTLAKDHVVSVDLRSPAQVNEELTMSTVASILGLPS